MRRPEEGGDVFVVLEMGMWGCEDVFVVLRLGFRKVGMCLWCCVRLARVLVIVHPGRDPFFFFTHPTDPHTLHRV
jgi:hypothetical protein